MYIAIVGTTLMTACELKSSEPADDASQTAAQGIAVFSFVPVDQASETVAAELTSAIVQTLKHSARFNVLTQPDLPPDMQDASRHDQWPRSELVSFILEGAVKQGPEGTSITVQLVDTSSDKHIWADTFEAGSAHAKAVASAIENEVMRAANR